MALYYVLYFVLLQSNFILYISGNQTLDMMLCDYIIENCSKPALTETLVIGGKKKFHAFTLPWETVLLFVKSLCSFAKVPDSVAKVFYLLAKFLCANAKLVMEIA